MLIMTGLFSETEGSC